MSRVAKLAPPPAHEARPVPAWYGDGRSATLHRYLSDDFVPQFLQDLADGSLATAESKAWLQEDRFADDGALVLRQPVHRAFYVLSAELRCRVPGEPPLDPRKVASAGMVVRRLRKDGVEEAWTLLRGVPIGWEPALQDGDPDVARRIARVRGAPPPDERLPYSGELSHPMHATTALDGEGRARTIVWGFVPVGSGSRPLELPPAMKSRFARPGKKGPAAGDELAAARLDMARQFEQALPQPFGSRSGSSARADGWHIDDGRASPAFIELLDVLVRQQQLATEPTSPAKATLEQRLDRFELVRRAAKDDRSLDRTLLDWLKAVRADAASEQRLQAWLDLARAQLPAIPSGDRFALPLPDAGGNLDGSVFIDADEAQQLRAELVATHGARVEEAIDDLTVPRFGQRDDDLYVAVPFVRVREGGCEHVRFGPPSPLFRVAAPLDAQAARPVQIQLPKLSDLRKALPKASFLAPDDLAEKLLSLPVGKGLTPDLAPTAANAFGLCWIFSFSLPAITICALIVLMIVLSLLDIVFRWMPYVFLRLPLFCLGIKKP